MAPLDGTPNFATGSSATISNTMTTSSVNSLVFQIGTAANQQACGNSPATTSIFVANGDEDTRGCQLEAPPAAGSQTLQQTIASGAWIGWIGAFKVGSPTPATTLTTAAFGQPISQGQALACVVGWDDATATLSGFSDSATNSWTQAAHYQGVGLSQYLYYVLSSVAAASDAVTVTWSGGGSTTPSIRCGALNGVLSFDQAVQAHGTATTAQVNVTPAQAAEYGVCFVDTGNNTTASTFINSPLSTLNDGLGNYMLQYPIYVTGAANYGANLANSVAFISGCLFFDTAPQTSATITVTGSVSIFTIKNQEPITLQQYAGSVFTRPLPTNTDNHCLGNVVCSSSSPDKAIINNIFGSSQTNALFQRIAYTPANASGGTGASGTYYCDSTCPIYKVMTFGNHTIVPAANDPSNRYFHMPSGALFGNATAGDTYLFVWDQSTDGSAGNSFPGGRRFTDYEYNGTANQRTLGQCSCMTTTCADNTASCQINPNYADYSFPLNDTNAINEGEAYVSARAASQVGFIRENELTAGVINHAIWLNTSCESGSIAYPAEGTACTCGVGACSGISTANRPAAGSLFKIANSFNCSTVTPVEMKAICVAMQVYGGYLTDTDGDTGNGHGVWPSRIEGGEAYNFAGIGASGLIQMALDANGTTLQCNATTITTPDGKSTPIFCSIQGLNQTNLVSGHSLEIIDPCIPLYMNGKAGGCTP